MKATSHAGKLAAGAWREQLWCGTARAALYLSLAVVSGGGALGPGGDGQGLAGAGRLDAVFSDVKGTLRLGSTGVKAVDDRGQGCERLICPFIQRLRPDGTVALFRYLPVGSLTSTAAVNDAGSLWVEVLLLPGARPTFDLGAGFLPQSSRFYARIDSYSGAVLFTTATPVSWTAPAEARGLRPKAIAVDRDGALWLGGRAVQEIPITPDAIQPFAVRGEGRMPAALLRIAPEGDRVTYATYLGDGVEGISSIVAEASGHIYVAGSRIWKLTPERNLAWSTCLQPGAVLTAALGPTGDLFVGGCTTSKEGFYATRGAFQETIDYPGVFPPLLPAPPPSGMLRFATVCWDGFVARLSPAGELIYSTLVGGLPDNLVFALAVNCRNEAFFAGLVDAPTKDVSWLTSIRAGRLSADGSALLFLTSLPPWLSFSTSLSPIYWLDGDHDTVMVGGAGSYTTLDGRTSTFLSINRLHELPATTPRIDGVTQEQLAPTVGLRVSVRAAGLCAAPVAVLDGREQPTVRDGDDTVSFHLNPVPAPRVDAFVPNTVSAYYELILRCGDSESAPANLALPYRVAPNAPAEDGPSR